MRLAILTLLVLLGLSTVSPALATPSPIEDYAGYAAPTKCHVQPRPGTALLARWVSHRFGGGIVSEGRACSKKDGPTSEHQTGQAFDWGNSVARRTDRRRVKDFMHLLFATDRHGNTDATARRMGVMYVIWDDQIYSAWNGFRPERYLNSACKSRKRCSQTLRHRDHVHVSLDLRGARGRTSWFEGRL